MIDISFSDSEVSLIGLYSSKPQFLKTTYILPQNFSADSSRCDILQYHPLSFIFNDINSASFLFWHIFQDYSNFGKLLISLPSQIFEYHKLILLWFNQPAAKTLYWALIPVSSIFPSRPYVTFPNSPSRHQHFTASFSIHYIDTPVSDIWSAQTAAQCKDNYWNYQYIYT